MTDTTPETDIVVRYFRNLLILTGATIGVWLFLGILLFALNLTAWLIGVSEPPWTIIAEVLGL